MTLKFLYTFYPAHQHLETNMIVQLSTLANLMSHNVATPQSTLLCDDVLVLFIFKTDVIYY